MPPSAPLAAVGSVLLVRRAQDGQLYALKQVHLSNRSAREQLEAVREAQLLAALDSPHITKYYDSFLHEGCLFICMEYAPCGSLHAAIRAMSRPLPEETIWRVLLQVTLALHHMHTRRMLHRDVKTLNIFLSGPLDQPGQPPSIKLGDVGVSKVLEEGRNHASTFLGTPLYLSPEMCNPSLILKILRGRYDPVLGLSAELTGIINRCLSQRRRTVQAGAVAERAPSPPKQQRAAAAASPAAAVRQHLANSLEDDDASQPVRSDAASDAPAQPRQDGSSPAAAPPAALKVTHFSVQQHLSGMSGAARQWLQQRSGGRAGAADGIVELEVQRSAKSDSSLLAWGADRAALAAAEAAASGAAPGDTEVAADEAAASAAQLRQRCVALLGSEARCAELLAQAKAAAAAEQGGSGGSGGSGGDGMASLEEAVYAHTGSAGKAGEVMFLLVRLLAAGDSPPAIACGVMRSLRAALALLLALAVARHASAGPLGDFIDGTAVPYGGPADGQDPHVASGGLVSGSCGYGQLSQQDWPHWAAVAVSPQSFLSANGTRHPLLGCGACLELRCDPRPGFKGRCPDNSDGASIIALVTDTCKDCPPTKLTLHYLAFQQKLANPDQGEVGIKYRLVECPAPGNIVADIDTYRAGAGGYIRLSLENVAGTGALESIELRKSPIAGDRLSLAGTSWTRMTNSWGSKWELSGLPEPPLDMRITSDTGEELVARQAIKAAGETGKQELAVQFSTAEINGTRDGITAAPLVQANEPACNVTLLDFISERPELSVLVQHLEAAGIAPLLEDTTTSITLFAPTDEAWAAVPPEVDVKDVETLQQILLFLITQGQVVVPDARQMLPEDLASGGVNLKLDTLNGAALQVIAGPDGIALRDGSSMTLDSQVVSANMMVCGSVVNLVTAAVPLPF
ncbi:hypothetical protein C2E21_3455 [Chlorella sorokiniana]|uniref:non-specific serine/threonine protein kinase n=1 Tax=Chlorella sorokiniana TaxID=3076 RepID=A0A2P6TUI4_CHLSO|nr:hypothetical protein C2E21_3455 [Chlorella sorokiniana]|eukprot:PRW57696.1 hypothetical protein C2E21_3455 [Chlorella sorokiniana]